TSSSFNRGIGGKFPGYSPPRNVCIPADGDSLTDLLILDLPQPQCISSLFCSFSRECEYRSSSQHWSEIDLHFVDEPLVERLTKNVAATFDQDAGDAAFT